MQKFLTKAESTFDIEKDFCPIFADIIEKQVKPTFEEKLQKKIEVVDDLQSEL